MAKSIFQGEAFRPLSNSAPIPMPPRLGDALSDALDDLSQIDQEIMKLIGQLPVDLVGQFSKRRDDCLSQSVFTRYTCLYQLARDIEKAVSGAKAPPPAPAPPPASPFPIIPVAIGGGVLLAGILYLVLRKK